MTLNQVPAAFKYCAECGAELVDKGLKGVPDWTVYNVGTRFDTKTGKPIGTKWWRTWECPNAEFVTQQVGGISIPRGWVHSSWTDYNARPPQSPLNVPLYVEALANGDLTIEQRRALDRHLAALEAVVEAAREVLIVRKAQMGVFPPSPIEGLRAALAALDSQQ